MGKKTMPEERVREKDELDEGREQRKGDGARTVSVPMKTHTAESLSPRDAAALAVLSMQTRHCQRRNASIVGPSAATCNNTDGRAVALDRRRTLTGYCAALRCRFLLLLLLLPTHAAVALVLAGWLAGPSNGQLRPRRPQSHYTAVVLHCT